MGIGEAKGGRFVIAIGSKLEDRQNSAPNNAIWHFLTGTKYTLQRVPLLATAIHTYIESRSC
jgi:hypothetical protein